MTHSRACAREPPCKRASNMSNANSQPASEGRWTVRLIETRLAMPQTSNLGFSPSLTHASVAFISYVRIYANMPLVPYSLSRLIQLFSSSSSSVFLFSFGGLG